MVWNEQKVFEFSETKKEQALEVVARLQDKTIQTLLNENSLNVSFVKLFSKENNWYLQYSLTSGRDDIQLMNEFVEFSVIITEEKMKQLTHNEYNIGKLKVVSMGDGSLKVYSLSKKSQLRIVPCSGNFVIIQQYEP